MKSDKENSSVKATLQKELKAIIKDLDEDNLIYLLKQAQVIKYNMEVDRINSEIVKHKNESNKNKKTIGLTAGASTPDWVINNVKEKIEKY